MKTLISVALLSLSMLAAPLSFAVDAAEKMDAVLEEKAGRLGPGGRLGRVHTRWVVSEAPKP